MRDYDIGGTRGEPAGTPSAERWLQIEPLLDAALALEIDKRTAFLRRVCAEDPGLLEEVSALLAECESGHHQVSPLDHAARDVFPGLAQDAESLAVIRSALAGRYDVERVLGRGGTGAVYLAYDRKHDRLVAIKVFPAQLRAERVAERFLREIRLTARLRHPRILPLYDSGEVEGRLYYVMPYVAGGTLRERLTSGRPFGMEEARRVLRDIAEALEHAHRQGVVHRDVKPENILLDETGAVLADFGIASAIALATGDGIPAGSMSELKSMPVGTPAYMAPEQLAANEPVDHRADLYALGVVAYEILDGSRDVTLPRFATQQQEQQPGIPTAFHRIVKQLVATRSADRPASAAAIVQALDTLDAQPIEHAITPTPAAKVATHRRVLRAAAGVLSLSVVAWGASWMFDKGTAAPIRARVLVIPLTNASPGEGPALLGRVAADYITQGLVPLDFVDVVPNSLPPGASDAEIRAAAREVAGTTVVAGSYEADGVSVRMQARVIDVPSWRLLGAIDAVRAPQHSPDSLLEPVRQRVMAVLAAAYDSRFAELRTGVQPTTYEAYEQLMQAGEFFVNGEFEKALASNARAAQADSTSMRPWIDASWIYINLDRLSDVDSILRHIEPRRATLNDADRAIIDLQRAIIDGDRMAQLQSARRLAKAAPGAPWSTYQQALYALAAGYPREALAAASRVESTYGLTGTSWMTGGLFRVVTRAHHMLGEHKAELEAARRARRAHPDSRTLLGHELRALVALAASGAPGSIDALRDGLAELARMPATSGGGVSAPLLLLQTAEELEVHGLAALAREAARYALAADSARSPAERERLAFERARAYYLLGEYSEAKRIIERLAQQSRNNPHQRDFTGMLGLIAAHDGRRAEAAAVDARLQDMDVPYDQGRTTYARARVAAALGDAPQALGLLQQSMREGVAWYTPHSDPELRPLRDDPRFVQLMRPRE